jgi:hypothetical protein
LISCPSTATNWRLHPLEERRGALVAGVDGIVFSEGIEGEGEGEAGFVFSEACAMDLEEIVPKRAGSIYWKRTLQKLGEDGGTRRSSGHECARLTRHRLGASAEKPQ